MAGEGYLGVARCFLEGLGRGDLKLRAGVLTTDAAVDNVPNVMPDTVLFVVACLGSQPSAGVGDAFTVSAAPGSNGSIDISSWQDDATAAANFGDTVYWVAVGY